MRVAAIAAVLLCCSVVQAKVFETSTHGKPEIKSIQVLSFGPEGTLLVGDGAGAAIFAIETNEKASEDVPAKVEGIREKLAARVGAQADGIEILDLAVHPTANVVYFAARKQDDKAHLIFTLKPSGEIGLLSLDSVKHARITLPTLSGAPLTRITDVAWVDDKLLAAAGTSEEFASKIFICPAPLKHEAAGELHSAETYHVAHHKWETKAPMSVILPYKEKDKTYVVGAFACTPVVKYSLDELTTPDAKVKGVSVIELGNGNRPLDMFTYEKDGKEYVLANTFRMHHAKKPFGPSPYWTVRFERDLLGENEAINEKALWRLKDDKPATDRIKMIEAFHGVTQMDRIGADRAAFLKEAEGGRLDFDIAALP